MCIGDAQMRSTLELPEELIAEAQLMTGIRTKREVVATALAEMVQRLRVERLIARLGHIDLDLAQEDLERMRAEE